LFFHHHGFFTMSFLSKIKTFLSDLTEEFLDIWTEKKPFKRKVYRDLKSEVKQWTKPTRPIGQPEYKREFETRKHIPLAKYSDLNVTWQEDIPVFHLGHYSGALQEAVVRLKYRNEKVLGKHLGSCLGRVWAEHMGNCDQTFDIVPIPLHPRRLKERGYNQAGVVAHYFGGRVGMPIIEALERVRYSDSQVGQSGKERRQNVRGAFQAKIDVRPARPVLLVDDVLTSGSTLQEAAQVLRAHGIEVWGAVVVATPRIE
jgi:ComF family protein